MARPNKPSWFAQRSCFRCRIDGKFHYFPAINRAVRETPREGFPRPPGLAWTNCCKPVMRRGLAALIRVFSALSRCILHGRRPKQRPGRS